VISFGRTHYVGFGPFEDAHFDFSESGLTMIEGEMLDLPECDSNGAGKSMLVEGLTWALFGKCLRRDFKHNDVVHNESSYAEVTVPILGYEGDTWVTRYRGHPDFGNQVHLYVGGEDVTRGRDTMTDDAIVEIIGMDFDTFVNSVAFGARDDVKSFFAAGDAGRKAILERLLGLEQYALAEDVAKRRLREVLDELSEATGERESLERKRGTVEARIEEVDDAHDEDLELRRNEAVLRIRSIAKKIDALQGEDNEINNRIETLKEKLSEERTKLKRERTRLRDAASEAREVMRQVDRRIAAALTKKEAIDEEIADTEALEGECPTCRQDVPLSWIKTRTTDLARRSKDFAKLLEAERKERAKLKKASDKASANYDEFSAEPEEPPEMAKARAAERKITSAMAELRADKRAEEKAVTGMDKQLARSRGKVGELEKQIEQIDLDIIEAKMGEEEIQSRADDLEFWQKGFGNAGLKSFLIEAEIPEINRAAGTYAKRLLGAGAKVRLSATTKLKSRKATREKLSIEGSIKGYGKKYSDLSKGQKLRMDLSILLAFRDLASRRAAKPLNLFVADELFDGMDYTGCENVIEMLREIGAEVPVILVTHDPRLKGAADRVAMIRHDGTKAEVFSRDTGGTPTTINRTRNRTRAKRR